MDETNGSQEWPGDFAGMADSIRSVLIAKTRDGRTAAECARLARRLGFDGFTYLVVRPGTVGTELLRHWTTAGTRWKTLYRKHAFHLVDPRVTLTVDRSVPLTWRHETAQPCLDARAFRDAASANGIRSGVSMSLRQAHGERAIVAWDCGDDREGVARADGTRGELAALALLACFLHERLCRERSPAEPTALAAALTQRECECLSLAARGLTSTDIAAKVGIAVRTVNFHIGNIVRKLGALNRGEAIARGVALNLITMHG